MRSPRIAACRWGRVEVEGQSRPLRDAMLYPGGAREWRWVPSGTGHIAGIQPEDVRELLERGAREVVLARGRLGLLHASPAALALLAAEGVPVHVLRTKRAVARYNELASAPNGRPVGALIHSTC